MIMPARKIYSTSSKMTAQQPQQPQPIFASFAPKQPTTLGDLKEGYQQNILEKKN